MTDVKLDKIAIVEKDSDDSLEVNGGLSYDREEPSSPECSRNIGEYETIDGPVADNSFPNDPAFGAIVRETEVAIEAGILPKLSVKGTSGCYFVHNKEKVIHGWIKGIQGQHIYFFLKLNFCPVVQTPADLSPFFSSRYSRRKSSVDRFFL